MHCVNRGAASARHSHAASHAHGGASHGAQRADRPSRRRRRRRSPRTGSGSARWSTTCQSSTSSGGTGSTSRCVCGSACTRDGRLTSTPIAQGVDPERERCKRLFLKQVRAPLPAFVPRVHLMCPFRPTDVRGRAPGRRQAPGPGGGGLPVQEGHRRHRGGRLGALARKAGE